MNFSLFRKTETLTFLLITILGVVSGEVTVFYIIYLFWFQELTRTTINTVYAFLYGKQDGNRPVLHEITGNCFILFIYIVFIVVLFGFMLNWDNYRLTAINLQTLLFRNLYFNINILLFTAQYIFYRKTVGSKGLNLAIFNRNHIILHVSIIVGALIQLSVVKRYPQYFAGDKLWGSALVVLPFLLLKVIFGKHIDGSRL